MNNITISWWTNCLPKGHVSPPCQLTMRGWQPSLGCEQKGRIRHFGYPNSWILKIIVLISSVLSHGPPTLFKIQFASQKFPYQQHTTVTKVRDEPTKIKVKTLPQKNSKLKANKTSPANPKWTSMIYSLHNPQVLTCQGSEKWVFWMPATGCLECLKLAIRFRISMFYKFRPQFQTSSQYQAWHCYFLAVYILSQSALKNEKMPVIT